MKTVILSLIGLVILGFGMSGCKSVHKNRSDGYSPAAQQCVTPTSPDCAGSATVGVQISMGAFSSGKALKGLFGRCEMYVDDSSEPKPCEGVKLVLTGNREGESKSAVFDGYNYKFKDVPGENATLSAESDRYEITSLPANGLPAQDIGSGRTLRLKVKTKPLR